jgi:uncharacterized membrane protein YgdD (TMEM256/DUF423 family)
MPRFFSVIGCFFGLIWVALGAIAAHTVTLDTQALHRFDLGLRMLIVHALALILLGAQQSVKHLPIRMLAGFGFLLGTSIFCGSLLALAFGAAPAAAKFAPTGGVLLMFGWALWGLSLMRKARP